MVDKMIQTAITHADLIICGAICRIAFALFGVFVILILLIILYLVMQMVEAIVMWKSLHRRTRKNLQVKRR